jgi:NAD(P)-dependent dehydrogenase (short-subunit alcohol dehydrogenase family)
VAEIVDAGGVASAHQLDVTDQASVARFVEQAEAMHGRIDVLVNTAGRLDEADTVRFEHMSADAAYGAARRRMS